MMEARSEIDKDLADLNGNAASFRLREDVAHLEAMSQTLRELPVLRFGSQKPKTILPGWLRGYSDATAPTAKTFFVPTRTRPRPTNTSIWLIAWDDSTIHGIYPKGVQSGIRT